MSWFNESSEGITIALKVVPRAKRDEIVGVEGDALKVRLTAPPVEGKANEELVKFLAKKLDVRRGDIEILHGETGRHKLVRVRGISGSRIEAVLKR